MHTSFYLEKFQKAADELDQKRLREKEIEAAFGVILDSVFLKLYKKSWASPLNCSIEDFLLQLDK
ncbi:hypothetical protein [Pedobacter sp. KBS0701]|uniref:hypothetical protein n=1 Tax=unclassified Pedobacter TaxID=2628915 RepID=UPI00110D880E|nr:hypothetical protein [Pedobacter sp. KBS0701]QDW27921.1 hypothetical protein FFJ24_025015 [Pedobacter sp. KBS0701]